jgi:SAM-dependent methyltransferase
MTNDTTFQRFAERYEAGQVPWDQVMPPPEIVALAAELPPGRALDLGCGYGRTAIYLAQRGWQVDGVDFVPQAIAEARVRAEEADVANRARFHHASVAELGFLAGQEDGEPNGRYQLAIDVGCLHALEEEARLAYRDGLLSLLEPGAVYVLFARLEERQGEDGPRGILETAVTDLFLPAFTLTRSEIGLTVVEDKSWRSGWFWFKRGLL